MPYDTNPVTSQTPIQGPTPGAQPGAPIAQQQVANAVGQGQGFEGGFGTVNNQGGGLPPVVPQSPAPSQGGGRRVAQWALPLLGVLFLLGAVGAGILLTQQPQEIREKASTAVTFCGGVSGGNTCNNNDFCWVATTTNQCKVNGVPEGSAEYFAGNDNFDGQVCYSCQSGGGVIVDPNQGTICSPGTKIAGNPAKCPGTTPPGPNPPPPPAAGRCDDACTTNADCDTSGPGGVALTCNTTIHKCVNPICPTDTIPGNNCDCRTAVQKCGDPCGSGYPLCGAGSSCRYINGPSCGIGSVSNPTTFCIPQPLPTGWTQPKCVARDTFNSYAQINGQNPTAAQIAAACTPVVTPTASCTNVKIYDTNWAELTTAQLSAKKTGDIIRFVVLGTSSSGTFDKARFTVNGTLRAEVTTKKPTTGEFYDEYTIPAGTTSFDIKAEIHHGTLNQWF